MAFLSKIFGDPQVKYLKKLKPLVEQINSLEEKFKGFSDEQLKQKTKEFKEQISRGQTPTILDSILPEAFALVREAARRSLGQRHYDVQLLCGIVLHQGKIAEMKTGEGKTLAATLSAYLNALEGRGVHVITVNDYLAKRDTVWMGQIYDLLGLSVGCITHEAAYIYDGEYQPENHKLQIPNPKQIQNPKSKIQSEEKDKLRDTVGGFKVVETYLRPVERKQAYKADITYGTNNEFGFDYLRDNLAMSKEQKAQRGFHYVILDEIDSILIDEARTPLIISQPDYESSKYYQEFSRIIPQLKKEDDYTIDEKDKAAALTEQGIDKIEKILGLTNIYTEKSIKYLHHLEQALRADAFFKKDRDYIIKQGQVIIIDEFTGRLMPGRRWSGGLHQAIEAKEAVEVQPESKTLASITFQNLFRFYQKLSGMTGTAKTSEEEFEKVYGAQVIVVPTNKPLIRKNLADRVYKTELGKLKAIVREIKQRHQKGQPVLVGTRSVEKNEFLSKLLNREGIAHEMLNAKNHQREGQIIAQAGRLGAVTVATNMAGRGVDIMLGGAAPSIVKTQMSPKQNKFATGQANVKTQEEIELYKKWEKEHQQVVALGGLHVIGTERHEARRIDDQLRGRAGRQGDPGSSQFFVSMEDDLLRIFGGDRIKGLMQMLKVPEDEPIEARILSSAIEKAQSKVEGMHFDVRKHVLEYDDVISKHRKRIYSQRNEILEMNFEQLRDFVLDIVEKEIHLIISEAARDPFSGSARERVSGELRTILPIPENIPLEQDKIIAFAHKLFLQKQEREGKESINKLLRFICLRTIDVFWTEHLDILEHLKDSVSLRAYGGKDPLIEYKTEGHRTFQQILAQINSQISRLVFKLSSAVTRPV